eukprot:1739231-Heterocapsa_arctica.AAC.1
MGGDIFWSPLGAFLANHPGTIGDVSSQGVVQEDAGGSENRARGSREGRRGEWSAETWERLEEAESRALAQVLQDEADKERLVELESRALAQALQDEADTEAMANEWITFFQQPAESE